MSVVQHSRYARGCVFGWLDAFMVRHFEISLFLGIATRSFCICILHLRVLLFILRQAAWVVRRVRGESRSQCFSFLLVLACHCIFPGLFIIWRHGPYIRVVHSCFHGCLLSTRVQRLVVCVRAPLGLSVVFVCLRVTALRVHPAVTRLTVYRRP